MQEYRTYGLINPADYERTYFPANTSQFERLVGQMLTQVEAMNLRESVEKANKDIVRQILWKWWSDVQENSLTSWKLCIGPIQSGQVEGEKGWTWMTEVGVTKAPDRLVDNAESGTERTE